MKIKGINLIERHVEKVVLALFSVFVLAVLVMQAGLIGDAREVSVGSGTRPLNRVLEGVKDMALQREARLKSDQVAPGIPASLPDPVTVFSEAIAASNRPGEPVGRLGDSTIALAGSGPAVTPGAALPTSGGEMFAAISPPAPSRPIHAQFEGTIDPVAVAELGEAISGMVPAEQPHDTRCISVQASFAADQLRQAIESPIESGIAPLPTAFWQGRLELIDVEWAREARLPDGAWGGETLLGVVPGSESLRELLGRDPLQPADYRELLDRERNIRAQIRRPRFLPTIAGQLWTWPVRARELQETTGSPEVDELKRELSSVRAEAQQVERRLERPAGGPGREPPPGGGTPPRDGRGPRNPPGGGGGGGRERPSADAGEGINERDVHAPWLVFDRSVVAQAGGDRPNRGGAPTPADERRKEREAQARARLEEQLAALVKREKEILDRLTELGVIVGEAAPEVTLFSEPLASLGSTESRAITLWTHDLTAKPGMTYRYRARVVLTNPFFGAGDRLPSGQASLAERAIVEGAWSEWSDEVSILPETVFYVSSATEAGGPLEAPARATAEVFTFFYGYWRQSTLSLEPGEALAGEMSFPKNVTFELDRDSGPAGRSRFVIKGKNESDATRAYDTGLFLLDTILQIGSGQAATQAYLGDRSGRTRLFRTTGLADDAGRNRLLASAALAKTAILREPGGAGPDGPPGGPSDPNSPDNPPSEPPPGSPPDRY